MKTIKFKITNNSNQIVVATLLKSSAILQKNYGMYDCIEVEIIEGEGEYLSLLQYFNHCPVKLKFVGSTNNRQLNFYYDQPFRECIPMEPRFSKHGKPRKTKSINPSIKEYGNFFNKMKWLVFKEDWDSRKWNIADSHETVIWSYGNFIEIKMEPNQEFYLEISMHEHVKPSFKFVYNEEV